jgi:hypothetical protein
MAREKVITTHVNRRKLVIILLLLPALLIVLSAILLTIREAVLRNVSIDVLSIFTPADPTAVSQGQGYPTSGASLDTSLFGFELPPPPLDALPYDINEPLSNGPTVPVKKRWLWLPAGSEITITTNADERITVNVPVGAMWWKEFYLETDRSAFLIERRIIARVPISESNPSGWAFYSSHAPADSDTATPIIIGSTSEEAARYMYAASDWLPTQATANMVEVRFADSRGVQYPYVFPGQTQCMVCHRGASGAYPNPAHDPIEVFGLHPENLTPQSYTALVERGWIVGGDVLLTDAIVLEAVVNPSALGALTGELVGVIRNNCASCHNSSPNAAAAFTAFIVDPNHPYSTQELLDLLAQKGRMMGDASLPLVTPGDLTQSEVWLRINGLDGRRRMPPLEGGLPEPDLRIIELWRAWILAAGATNAPLGESR